MKKIIVCIIMFLFLCVGLVAKPTMYPIKWVKSGKVSITIWCIEGKMFILTEREYILVSSQNSPSLIQVMDKGGAVKCGVEK
jgi:hypothetical protein